ncbi:sulfatase-like hydrolase/transferase [Aquisphaera giovannonii]|nr:sulfatase-like hydrolase/transferase [Aquisphaera giovannonii]
MACAFAAGTGSSRGADAPPNIVLIVADDLGWADVGFNGRAEWATPSLDRLASRGMVLKRCYASAPVCGPSRACLLTGKYSIHNGVIRNDQDLPGQEVTIAEALKHRGYRSLLAGKWQQGRARPGREEPLHPLDQGFDEFFGYTNSYEAMEKFPTKLWEGRERVEVSGYVDDLITDRVIRFLDQSGPGPFFLDVSYLAPHFTVAAPEDEVARHVGKLPETDRAHPLNATYAAMVTRLDRNVGRLLDALERRGLASNTLVVVVSDNGATFEFAAQGTSVALDSNRPFRGQKRTLWEGGIRIPAVVSWPGRIAEGKQSDEVVNLIDLMPTLLAAAGVSADPSWHVDGVNVLPSWLGIGHVPARTLFWEWRQENADQVAAMRGDFKLLIQRGGKPELYNVAADPAERQDVAAIHPQVAKDLRRDLERWLASEDARGKE